MSVHWFASIAEAEIQKWLTLFDCETNLPIHM